MYRTPDNTIGGGTSKNKLPEVREPLADNIPSHAIEQANQEVRQDDHHSQHIPNQASLKCIVISVYLNSVCYLILYTRLFTELNLFNILLYITFLTKKFSRSTVVPLSYCSIYFTFFFNSFIFVKITDIFEVKAVLFPSTYIIHPH